MATFSKERLFIIGMWWRIVYGVLRILFGLSLLKLVGTPFASIIKILMRHELAGNHKDVIYLFANNILNGHTLYITYFLSFYFIFWGVVDIFLSYNLLKYKLWAFPTSFILIGFFIIYEIVRFTHTHSLILLWVISIDISILWLLGREYKKITKVMHANH